MSEVTTADICRAANTTQLDARNICEAALDTYRLVYSANDPAFSRYDSPVYKAAKRALILAIREAYGLSALKAERVHDVHVDSGEDVLYCVAYVLTHTRSSAYTR